MILEGEGSHNAALIAAPTVYRYSLDEYVESDMDETDEPDPLEFPPSYDALIHPPWLRRRFDIQPREDEGRELLPAYSSYISLESIFEKKMELEGAVHRAPDRNWHRVWVTLQGTALTFHKCKAVGMFQRVEIGKGKNHNVDFPSGMRQTTFVRSYNLQHADVGVAADYHKKRYVIRVRAEADQFLLSCVKIETFVLWLQSLIAAIDLAPPLDDRQIPRDLSIPRTRGRRARPARPAVTATGDVGNNAEPVQEEIPHTQSPRLVDPVEENEEDDEDAGAGSSDTSTDSEPASSADSTPARSIAETSRPSTSRGDLVSRVRMTMQSSPYSPRASATTFSPSTPNPSITSEGKWRPDHQWTHFYDMMYAKRCMAVLTRASPRKSNLMIMKGKQWIVDWATGALTRCEPPDYGEAVTSPAGTEQILVQGGN